MTPAHTTLTIEQLADPGRWVDVLGRPGRHVTVTDCGTAVAMVVTDPVEAVRHLRRLDLVTDLGAAASLDVVRDLVACVQKIGCGYCIRHRDDVIAALIPHAGRTATSAPAIPADLHRWDAAHITEWLGVLADDESTTDEHFEAVAAAASAAVLGPERENADGNNDREGSDR